MWIQLCIMKCWKLNINMSSFLLCLFTIKVTTNKNIYIFCFYLYLSRSTLFHSLENWFLCIKSTSSYGWMINLSVCSLLWWLEEYESLYLTFLFSVFEDLRLTLIWQSRPLHSIVLHITFSLPPHSSIFSLSLCNKT